MMAGHPDLEFSTLSGPVVRDGSTVQVHIYRLEGSEGGWVLEVVNDANVSTTFDELFPTKQAAFDKFKRVLVHDGIHVFLGLENKALP